MSTARTASTEPVRSPPRPPPPSPSASTASSSTRTVEYVGQRIRLEFAVGSFQAVKHRLADTLIALESTQPLLRSVALAPTEGTGHSTAGVAAAKVTAGEASYAAARTALRLHGAVGSTQEPDLVLWTRKARPLRDAWGIPAACRARVLAA